MHQLPETGFLRIGQIIGNSKSIPPSPALIPISKSTWWAGIQAGRFPKGIKLGPRTTAWRVEDIRSLLKSLSVEDDCCSGKMGVTKMSKHSSLEQC